jgi:hypothetical protein
LLQNLRSRKFKIFYFRSKNQNEKILKIFDAESQKRKWEVQFFNKIGKFDQKKIHSGSGPKKSCYE